MYWLLWPYKYYLLLVQVMRDTVFFPEPCFVFPGVKHFLVLSCVQFFCIFLKSESENVSLTLCNTIDCSPPVSSVHGILQAGILECVAIPFSKASSQPRDQTPVFCITGRFFTIWATRKNLLIQYSWISLICYDLL